MRLRRPTDFLVLEALEAKGRNVATNLADHTGKSRKNINTRLPILEDYGLVKKIGPAERSGLYEITTKGKSALIHQEQYDEVEDFEALIEGPQLDEATGGNSSTAMARGDNVQDDG